MSIYYSERNYGHSLNTRYLIMYYVCVMFIYHETVQTFLNQCKNVDPIDGCKEIADAVKFEMLRAGITQFNPSQERAWRMSLPVIAKAIQLAKLDLKAEVAIEYKLHQQNNRIDFLVSGIDEFGQQNLVIIELKGWEKAQKSSLPNHVYTNTHGSIYEDHVHPSIQAADYAASLKNFYVNVRKIPINLHPCSYLHNINDLGSSSLLLDETRYPVVKTSLCFLEKDVNQLVDFLNKHVRYPSDKILYEIEQSDIVPSDELGANLYKALKGDEFFGFDPSQRRAIDQIVCCVREAVYYHQKKTIIIKGGAGCGKSVVALNVLGKLVYPKGDDIKEAPYLKRRINAAYFTSNAAPRSFMQHQLIKDDFNKNVLRNLFKNPTSLVKSNIHYTCGLFDEAHRIFDFKGGQGLSQDAHVFDHTIKMCDVSVFFIDEDQFVTDVDYATIDRIKETARRYHSWPVEADKEGIQLELTSQYRCLGGEMYTSFVKTVLGYNGYNVQYNMQANTGKKYDLRFFDSAQEMFDAIKQKDLLEQEVICKNNGKPTNDFSVSGKCRLVAGYTKKWISKGQDRSGPDFDFDFEDNVNGIKKRFKAKWNLNTGQMDYSWLFDPLSVNEVGCIHTAQGLDLNYCGVIIGEDVIIKDGKIDFNPSVHPSMDKAFSKNTDIELAKKIIRNSYNVLLTRGIKGTYIYCANPEVRKYIEQFIVK